MNYNILLPRRPYIEQEGDTKAEIIVENLHPGYGVTLGNALRRVLFSSLPGSAVTRVKISGVNHEFSTIPGVLEDVLLILLNIKQLRFRIFSDEPVTISFETKNEGIITAADIKTPSNVEIVNKGQHIATITKKNTTLGLEMTVERGVGYRSKESLESDRVEAGMIVLDAIFTPVRKVSYHVDNMRVGTVTDYNKLKFMIETDGTITPREAFMSALEILIGQLQELRTFQDKKDGFENIPDETVTEKELETHDENYTSVSIEDVKLSSHTLNALTRHGFKTLGDLIKKSEDDLRLLEGIGEKAIQEIHRELGNFGLMLKQE
ncbi:MAG: DNA-directed RNA polymerase subunit alpha [Candidatus Ryanbacteria bacterium RIFCSPHIGHO2_12_FULL_47_12b]|uniref:DNA-directed RNA polymerase subunit alpha n=1 Tax=Candidatus Ryanbacteria bacterium RIFCSPLOWO2_02_FULL_47_14 TaxID=1802129 RepID=A0A1G2H0Y3_9BACT|nr:MAG: DNA-directed RNA polymerase subunit alpha [Parcubacteria group bacterium GW2011_GWA2_47_10b]KKU85506.1 MAG: DNA-directed RNA polymerase subunit alpha [Parcubacteria group bacterium GW2011_GWA1_47_9]OGZ44661.1 MAG: DNA-directed RNA polymerase subunit alpha [Candidatus Ryanbacteria bacterium RIFCSPHIGHO2_01_FULL_48_80]OGZ48172.1 MAG: DNA-directed RNA polymerase subunit alpha [Candidatus Ryanbacteria bacterium RIFCSPHIGHO2_02_FULL_47_25]OGZ51794.1 MAG: DNA-directed RNA polymerase subunit a